MSTSTNSTTKSKVVTREAAQRLLRDVRVIIKNPLSDNGIYYMHDDEDMLKGYAMIIGPSNTPYFGGYYFFEFDYPGDYPFSPPTVTYKTNNGKTRFNPNLYKCGKVCVSILNTWTGEKWSACQSISSILLTLCSLLNDTPFLNEPGQGNTSPGYNEYHKSIEFMNIDFAVCDMINHIHTTMPNFANMFFSIMKEEFLKNYEKILTFVQEKAKNQSIPHMVSTNIYMMQTNVDYKKCEAKLIDTKNALLK
jgi:ubiquitin-protein ligase